MNVEAGFQLGDLKGIVRRRMKVIAGVVLLMSLGGFWLAMALPNEYGSSATILVEPQAVDPDLVAAGVPTSDLNRRLHLMAAQILSRPRLSRIIDELNLYEDESKYLTRDEVISLMRDHVRVEPIVPELEQEQHNTRREFTIDQFAISFRDDSPVKARDVAQRLANNFIEEHIANRIRTSSKSLEFVESELARLAEAIQQVESQVATVKGANTGRLPEDAPSNQRRLERLIAELADTRRQAAAARSDEAFFHSQAATARSLLESGPLSGGTNTPLQRKRQLELLVGEYDARGLTDKHPDVIKATRELAAISAQLEGDESGDGAPNSFAEQNANAEAERARLRRVHAEEQVLQLEQSAEQVQRLLAGTPEVAEQLDALNREYRHLFESYQDFSNRRLEAGVQADLERRQLGEKFRVLEAAFLATEPVSPNRPVIIVVGVLFGLALGGALGILLEAADQSVHGARQLQTALDLPVLVSIPQIWLEFDRRKLRRSRIKTAAAATALLVFGLVGGIANYWWVNGGIVVQAPEQAPAGAGAGAGAEAPEAGDL